MALQTTRNPSRKSIRNLSSYIEMQGNRVKKFSTNRLSAESVEIH
jgi:hypothetical protein